jgi:hypothetical protein
MITSQPHPSTCQARLTQVSYDLDFYRRLPAEGWEEAFQAHEDPDRAGGRPAAEVWSRIVARATQILGDVEVSDAEQYLELTHDPTGIQLSCWSDFAAMNVPYWYTGAEATAVMERVYALAQAVEQETGLEGYDPQLDQPLADLAHSKDELAGQTFDFVTREMDAYLRQPGTHPDT